MKKKIYSKLLLAGTLLVSSSMLSSCDDFLTLLPTNQLPEENFWQDKADLNGVRAGAYDQLAASGQTGKILIWGELRGDNLSLNTISNTSIDNIQNAVLEPSNSMFDWSGFYTGINLCNLVIEKGEEMTIPNQEVDPSFTRGDYRAIRSEMMALRSLYYFYLVRAYRDVPYVSHSVRTDAEAKSNKLPATPGVAILGACIDSVVANLPYAAENFGSSAENKGRFTIVGEKTLLADMYLWRACMLKDYVSKAGSAARVNMNDVAQVDEATGAVSSYQTVDGQIIDDAYCNELAKECLQKSIQYSGEAIDWLKKEYDKRIAENPNGFYSDDEKTQPYPLTLNERTGTGVSDASYADVFGTQNSENEGIFELQYDGSTTTNSVVNSYFSTYANSQFTPGTMTLAIDLVSSASSVDPTIGFGKTDFRLLETCNYSSTEVNKPVTKFVTSSFSVDDIEDLTKRGSMTGLSARTSSSNNAHWQIYRLTDVMLIKAEALARLNIINNTNDKDNLVEGYQLVNQIFKRNNPGLVSTAEASSNSNKTNLGSSRLDGDGYCLETNGSLKSGITASALLSNVYRERQREFVGEGKRWFDIVRQAEYSYVTNQKNNTTALGFGSFKATVINRLSKLYSLYNPIYSEELKVNGKGQAEGGQLEQNPVWDRYTKK